MATRRRVAVQAGLAAACLLLLAGCGQGGKTLATVNGSKITMGQFDDQVKVLEAMHPGEPMDLNTRRMLVDQLVQQELLVQEAKKEGLDQKPDLQAQILRETQDEKQSLESTIENARLQLKQIDKAVKDKVLIEALIDAKAKELNVGDKDVKAYYDNLKKENKNIPPLASISERIRQQIVLEKVIAAAKEKADVNIHMDLVSQGGAEDSLATQGPPMPGSH